MDGRAAEVAQRMRQMVGIEDIIIQMETRNRARDELRQFAGVKGSRGCPRSSRRYLPAGVGSGSVVRERCCAEVEPQAGAEALSRMQRAANAIQTIRRYMAAPTANVAEVARVIAGFAAEDRRS